MMVSFSLLTDERDWESSYDNPPDCFDSTNDMGDLKRDKLMKMLGFPTNVSSHSGGYCDIGSYLCADQTGCCPNHYFCCLDTPYCCESGTSSCCDGPSSTSSSLNSSSKLSDGASLGLSLQYLSFVCFYAF